MDYRAEISVAPSQAGSLITAQFPQLAGQRATLLGEGWDNTAYRVGREWVFRFPRRAQGAKCLETEIAVMPGLAPQLSLPVSSPVLVGEPTPGFPWRFAGHRWLPGRTSCATLLTDKDRLRMARPLAKFLAQLHSVDVETARNLGAPLDELGRLDPEKRVPATEDRLDQLVRANVLQNAEPWRDAIRKAVGDGTLDRRDTRSLVHGDLYARHLLMRASENGSDESNGLHLNGIIDWGDIHVGDPAVDLAVVDLVLPPPARSTFFDVYGKVDAETRRLARFRAILHAATTASYAWEIEDAALLKASKWALTNVLLPDA